VSSEGAEMTSAGRVFQTRAPATEKARRPTVSCIFQLAYNTALLCLWLCYCRVEKFVSLVTSYHEDSAADIRKKTPPIICIWFVLTTQHWLHIFDHYLFLPVCLTLFYAVGWTTGRIFALLNVKRLNDIALLNNSSQSYGVSLTM